MRRPKRQPKTNEPAVSAATDQLDKLAEFEEFAKLLPEKLRKDFLTTKDAEELRNANTKLAQLRVLMGLMDPDSKIAMAAAKDTLDRAEGRAVERKETSHRMQGLSDTELDALLTSKLRSTAGKD